MDDFSPHFFLLILDALMFPAPSQSKQAEDLPIQTSFFFRTRICFCETVSQAFVHLWFHIIHIISCVTKCFYVIAGCDVLVCLGLGSRQANTDCIMLSIILLIEVFCLPINHGFDKKTSYQSWDGNAVSSLCLILNPQSQALLTQG